MKKVYTILIFAFCFIALHPKLNAQLVVDGSYPIETMVEDFFSDGCVSFNNISFVGDISVNTPSIGFFDASATYMGLDAGIILANGCINGALGPNNSNSETCSAAYLADGDYDLDNLIPGYSTWDATVLTMDIVPEKDTIVFEYVFGSEEYIEYVGSAFNDIFAFFIQGGEYDEITNIALIPDTIIPVSINNVNSVDNSAYYVNNETGPDVENLQYDGYTVVLTAKAAVTPMQTYTIKIAVADAGDSVLDSGVFLSSESLCKSNTEYLNANFTLKQNDLKVNLTNKTKYGIHYLWDFGDGNQSSLADAISYTYKQPGVYDISLTAYNAAKTIKSTITKTVVIEATGLNNLTNQSIIQTQIVGGQLYLEASQPVQVLITDVAGRCILNNHLPSGQTTVNLSPFGQGLYLLQATNGRTQQNTKIVFNSQSQK
ncbi:MAG: choice-of-anchor L domain-containing protein [Sphingobacteriales bacterium]|nr:choice-of-anchor L domain-containing protein [Sphingobacteriales bacterium]